MNPIFGVINADDFGFSRDINSAIEELHRAGIVTNATLMVDGPHVHDAIAVLRRNPKLGVGLHLDLCPVVGLYSQPYDQMRAGLTASDMQNRVADEVDRQIACFKRFGLEFSHMDSHRHFHALPELLALVVQVATGHGLKSLRLTKDWILPRTPSVYWSDSFFQAAKEMLQTNHVTYPDHFLYGWKQYSPADFKPGLNELMVHVGYADEQYRRERDLLSSLEFKRGLENAQVELTRYSDASASAVSCHRA